MIAETRLSYRLSRWTVLALLVLGIPLVCIPVRGQAKAPAVPPTPALSHPGTAAGKVVSAETGKPSKNARKYLSDPTSPKAERANLITNSIGMKLTLIPAGEFMMGSRETPKELTKAFAAYDTKRWGFTGEQPSHRVRITRPFYLGANEVTRGQFRRFVDDSGYETDAEKGDHEGIFVMEFVERKTKVRRDPEGSWRKVGFYQRDEHPVVGVSWNDATAFCKWLSRKEGKTYRLPTEAEWEYACRAGSTTRYFNGDDPEDLALIENVADATAKATFSDWRGLTIRGSDGYVYTAPVGKFRANEFGLYDMHGNVGEWCADWYDAAYYKESPSEDPAGPATGSLRVFRSGNWGCYLWRCRSADRGGDEPTWRSSYRGFRVALVQVELGRIHRTGQSPVPDR